MKCKIIIIGVLACIVTLLIFYLHPFDKKNNKKIDISNLFDDKKAKIVSVIPKENIISLVAVGDALIHSGVYEDAQTGYNTYDFRKMFTYIEPLIKDYDLRYYNQETIIGGKNLGISNYPRFNSPDEIGQNLVDIGFNMVSLANNHALDKGEAGILHSVKFWNSMDIIISGQYDSMISRNNIKIYEKNNIKYAFLAYTDSTNRINVPKGKEYLLNIFSKEQAKADIDSIKDKVDLIIVSMHWGTEYSHIPNNKQKDEAKYLASLGVNVIIGSHAHVIQPVDYIEDTLVIYSLGNFISAQYVLGLDKQIGLMVGMDISVLGSKVKVKNLKYTLLYTYSTKRCTNFKVIPFDKLTSDILKNYDKINNKYLNIVTSEVNYD